MENYYYVNSEGKAVPFTPSHKVLDVLCDGDSRKAVVFRDVVLATSATNRFEAALHALQLSIEHTASNVTAIFDREVVAVARSGSFLGDYPGRTIPKSTIAGIKL
jgi:hypothetical protein